MKLALAAVLVLIAGEISAAAQEQATTETARREEQAANARIWSNLERAYQDSRAAGDLAILKSQLQQVFSNSSEEKRRMGLRWTGQHLPDLTYAEQEELNDLYIELHPEDVTSKSLRNTNARNRLAVAPREQRATLYWAAVRQGQTRIPDGDTLVRDIALGMAAADGLEEFEGAIKQYAAEINRRYPHVDYQESDLVLVLLRFRSGAANRRDGYRLQAERLTKIADEEFSERMDNDAAFRQGTFNVASLACGERQSDVACRELARILERQLAYQAARGSRKLTQAAGDVQPAGTSEPLWMSQYRGWTQGALGTMKVEQEQRRRARQR